MSDPTKDKGNVCCGPDELAHYPTCPVPPMIRGLRERVAELEAAARNVVATNRKVGGYWHVLDGAFQDLAELVATASVSETSAIMPPEDVGSLTCECPVEGHMMGCDKDASSLAKLQRTSDACSRCGQRMNAGECMDCIAKEAWENEPPRPNEAKTSRNRAIWEARKAGVTVPELGERFDLRQEVIKQVCVREQAREQACTCGALSRGRPFHEPPCPLSDPAELALCTDKAPPPGGWVTLNRDVLLSVLRDVIEVTELYDGTRQAAKKMIDGIVTGKGVCPETPAASKVEIDEEQAEAHIHRWLLGVTRTGTQKMRVAACTLIDAVQWTVPTGSAT
jgi:hypothetical protein